MKDKEGFFQTKSCYYLAFTVLFAVTSSLVFFWYIVNGASFISEGDGWRQHYKAFQYYSVYLKGIVANLFNSHRFIVPEWDFYISEGNDVLSTFHYYCLGDPVCLLLLIVPQDYIYVFYYTIVLLRIYAAGIAFSVMCSGLGKRYGAGIMCGAFAYMFCYFVQHAASTHPFFLLPMVYFPLIILGTEHVFERGWSPLFIISLALLACSNFYFFYMIAISVFIYCVVRALNLFGLDFRKIVVKVFQFLGHSLISAMISGIILVPILGFAMANTRHKTAVFTGGIIYPLSFYTKMFHGFLIDGSNKWTSMGFAAPVMIAVIMLFFRKRNTTLRILFIIINIFMCFPIFGYLMNGMTYTSNRWSFVYALLCSYILVDCWDLLFELSQRMWIFLVALIGIYFTVCSQLPYCKNERMYPFIVIMALTLMVLNPFIGSKINKKIVEMIMIFIVICSVSLVSFWFCSAYGDNRKSAMIPMADAAKRNTTNEIDAIKACPDYIDNEYVRYTGRSIEFNDTVLNKISSTQFYWSLSNPYMDTFRADIEMREGWDFHYKGYDDRTELISLSGTKYYADAADEDRAVPYGYEIEDNGEYSAIYRIYKNKNTVPIGYTCDSVIPESRWNSMTALEKQKSMMHGIYVNDDVGIKVSDYEFKEEEALFEVETDSKHCVYDENRFVVTKKGASATLYFDAEANSETYLEFLNFNYTPSDTYDMYFGGPEYDPNDVFSEKKWNKISDEKKKKIINAHRFKGSETEIWMEVRSSNGNKKDFLFYDDDADYYSGRHDFIINTGYDEKGVTSINIRFPETGVYSFDYMKVLHCNMDGYEDAVKTLAEEHLENLNLGPNILSGEIVVCRDKLLCVQTPYLDGWSAYIDGEKVPVYVANEHYLAVRLAKGKHNVVFKYQTKGLILGLFLSVVGMGVFIVLSGYFRQTRSKEQQRIKQV